ncbi:hypothetical protein HKCCE2091_08315 [Rhodobacterales bacterium HKCCE2091]|nr:hypothetical protein [Rhodobacterales bacterium HKCCE2091]
MTPTLSPSALFSALFSAAPPAVIDIRIPEDIAADPGRFPAAWRFDHRDRDGIAAVARTGCGAVMICHGGLKLSQGVASRLRGQGIAARSLEGGVLGWRGAGLPLWPGDEAVPVRVAGWDAASAAARWLATRFLPRPIELLTVAPDQVEGAAARFDGDALPDARALLDRLDRPVPRLAAALEAAATPLFARLAAGHEAGGDDGAAVFADLDALLRAPEMVA